MSLAYRDAGPEDRHFIGDGWVRSYQHAKTAGIIGVASWFRVMIPEVTRIIEWPGTRTLVAYETTETSRLADLYGFIVAAPAAAPPIVFYVFVAEPYRRRGVARGLFRALGIDPQQRFVYACTTGIVSKLYGERKIPFATWDPLVARFSPEDTRRPRRAR